MISKFAKLKGGCLPFRFWPIWAIKAFKISILLTYLSRKKPKNGSLSDAEKADNKQLARRRIVVEHVIGHLKKWQILAACYRGLLTDYAQIFKLSPDYTTFSSRDNRGEPCGSTISFLYGDFCKRFKGFNKKSTTREMKGRRGNSKSDN